MKRKFFTFFLCSCLLLSGCRASDGELSETAGEASPSAETTAEEPKPAETTASPKETASIAAQTTTTAAALSLDDIPYGKLNSFALTFWDPDLRRYWGDMLHEPKNYSFQYRGSNSLSFRDVLRAREANPTVGSTDEEKAEIYRFAEEGEFLPFSEWKLSPYRLLERTDGTDLTVEKIGVAAVYVEDILCGYKVGSEVTLRAFVTKTEENRVFLIPDPRFLNGLPVFETNPERMDYDLDGLSLALDSFPVNAWCYYSRDMEKLEERTEGYLYAQVTLWNLEVNYSFSSGYDCSATLGELVPITADLEAAVSGPFLMPEEGKDPEMAAVYTAMLENAEQLYTEDTYGILLLDLDFDGTPEVLRTRCADELKLQSVYRDGSAEIDIYRIENETLRYLDSFESVIYASSSSSRIDALLGRKTLSDGTRGWYGTSGQNFETKERDGEHCYFYCLNGDTLTATELAAEIEVPAPGDEYTPSYRWFYYGEELKMTEELVPSGYEDGSYVTAYTWNGKTVIYTPYLFYVNFKDEFTEDISEVYLLFSDWILPHETWIWEYNGETEYYYSKFKTKEKKELSLQALSYQLAYLVDAYYLGDYSPEGAKHRYEYETALAKPVIYLYPEEETEVSVRVDFSEGGELTCTYPEYGEGWEVTALPDGTIYDKDGNEYYCLYWEGEGNTSLEQGKGWCVAGEDTALFLREKLLEIGLTAREVNEFIIYWLPEMQDNPYNVITFHTDDYARSVPLTVSPAPDTVIRVFMTFEPTDAFTEIAPQTLPHYERKGFTVVEWGGSHTE